MRIILDIPFAHAKNQIITNIQPGKTSFGSDPIIEYLLVLLILVWSNYFQSRMRKDNRLKKLFNGTNFLISHSRAEHIRFSFLICSAYVQGAIYFLWFNIMLQNSYLIELFTFSKITIRLGFHSRTISKKVFQNIRLWSTIKK